ncbi:MAG: hypothetical protein OHK0012_21600 [Synechococcales cyanobacterium]
MDKQQLLTELEQLHHELQHLSTLDSEQRILLQQVAKDIHQLLKEDRHQELGLLGHAMDQLAAAHPQASLLMGKIADTLANMGI